MPRPSEVATGMFGLAQQSAADAIRLMHKSDISDATVIASQKKIAESNYHLAGGLQQLSIALRATYILLEELKTTQQRR